VKIIRSEEKFTNQSKIEIKILEYIQSHDKIGNSNVVKILDHFMFRTHVVRKFLIQCIVFELLEMNLYELIKSHNFSGLEPSFVRNIAIQLLNCIVFLQANSIIHCDLKPENILLMEWNKTNIKVIDFGSSCFDSEKLYAYIQSRYYRAPEVILGLGYNPQIDMWSLGCVLAELFTGI
jgi:dual specificity tyrosine-phosphorylation-regulated kinase 2/3/4